MGIEEVVKAIIREEGFELGKIQGKAAGRAEGKAQGKAEGKAQGKKERDLELIHNFIFNLGYSNEKAASLLKVSVKFVEDVRAGQLLTS